MAEEAVWPNPLALVPEGAGIEYLAVTADDLLRHIVGRSDRRTKSWTDGDRWSFHDWQQLERLAPVALSHAGIDQAKGISDQLEVLHCALPYSDAERRWLRIHYGNLGGSSTSLEKLRAKECVGTSQGIRHAMMGADLLDRWGRWRRRSAEFSDQGSLSLAVGALERISTMRDGR